MAIDVNDFDIDIETVPTTNVGETERWVSMIGGGALLLLGLSKKSFGGLLLAALGGGLMYRGKTAHCPIYERLGVSTNNAIGTELVLEASTTIYRSPEEVYRFYRDFDNLPRFMKHLASVTPLGGGRSRWVMVVGGKRIEWDAQIVEEREYELIRWRSLEGADLEHHGQVRFDRAPGDRGTEVHVMWRYQPPGSVAGTLLAKLAQIYTSTTLKEELYRMKQILEAGEIATIEGQPSGRDKIEPAELAANTLEPGPARLSASSSEENTEENEPQPTLH